MLKEHGITKKDADSAEKKLMNWICKNYLQLFSETRIELIIGIEHTKKTKSMVDQYMLCLKRNGSHAPDTSGEREKARVGTAKPDEWGQLQLKPKHHHQRGHTVRARCNG